MRSQVLLAAQSVKLLTVNMLLSAFLPPGVLGQICEGHESRLSLTAPQKMEALSGTCLRIPCSFNPAEFYINSDISAGWIKRDNGIFDTSNSVKIFSVKLTGNLKQKNCTTEFSALSTSHSGEYFFRVKNEPFKATAVCYPLHVTVTDSAWSPSISVSGDLKEKESVSISCSAWTPCPLSPPELTWSLQQDSQRQTETNPDGTFTSKIQHHMTLSDTHDGSTITCSVRYPVDGGKRNKAAETTLTLSVSYAPKDTSASISPSGLVSAGSWVELSCSSRAKPPVRTFTWFRNSTGGFINVSVEQVYGFHVTEGGEFYCVAANNLGNQTSPVILLTAKSSPVTPLVWVGILSGIVLLVCLLVSVWCFRSKHGSAQQTQSPTAEEFAAHKAATEPEEELHYGDVRFFKNSPEAASVSQQDRGQQESVYADIKVP